MEGRKISKWSGACTAVFVGKYRFVWIIAGLIEDPGNNVFGGKFTVLCRKENHDRYCVD